MSVRNLPVEVNSFVGGLVTEASPLTFPENASIDEQNFVLNRNGSRRRRLGMDKFSDTYATTIPSLTGKTFNTFKWDNAGGVASRSITVCQIDSVLLFFDLQVGLLAPAFIGDIYLKTIIDFSTLDVGQLDMTSVDGLLVIATGERELLQVSIVNDVLSTEVFSLEVRDLFGVQDPYSRVAPVTGLDFPPDKEFSDLLLDQDSKVRPYELTYTHMYNLRNQSWGRIRDGLQLVEGGSDLPLLLDPIYSFKTEFGLTFPSNSDSVATGIIDYAELKGAPERFIPAELGKNSRASSSAAKGFFIIDALNRGESRSAQYAVLMEEAGGDLLYDRPFGESLPQDKTEGGAICLEEFAGRVWYGGFGNNVIGPDSRSPKMSSYVLFSQLVKDLSGINKCYQNNDPTYEQEADLLATDGGFIRVDGAYGIKRLLNLGSSLLVLATNGTWSIEGGSDEGFTAEAYRVTKISDRGVLSSKSSVVIDNTVMYWGEDGIYYLAPDQFGKYQSQNISKSVIQKLFESIPFDQRKEASGVYDKYTNTVKWLYGEKTLGSVGYELVFDLELKAFYPSKIGSVSESSPVLLAPLTVLPFDRGVRESLIVVGADQVQAGGVDVVVTENLNLSGQSETIYLTLWEENGVQICFSSYSNIDFKDWESFDSVGIDADAYLITGYGPSGDFQRRKQVPYLTSYLLRTEDGFDDVSGDIIPSKPSSCKLQARWEWANSPNGNKWGREFETYRYSRFYMPEDINDEYDTGDKLIVTKNKLRGHGKTLSLKFSTSPNKDCNLLGWSMIVGVSTSV